MCDGRKTKISISEQFKVIITLNLQHQLGNWRLLRNLGRIISNIVYRMTLKMYFVNNKKNCIQYLKHANWRRWIRLEFGVRIEF